MSSSTSVAAVKIKVPQFLPSSPATWFTILEAQFNLASISVSSTKFYHAISKLPIETVTHLDDSVVTSNDYDKLKDAVKLYHESTKGELFDTLLQNTPLTGKPSHFLIEIKKIANQVGANDDLIRHRFQQALPSNLAPLIASQKNLPLDDLGRLADELIPLLRDQSICEVGTGSNKDSSFGKNNFHTFNKPHVSNFSTKSLTLKPFSDGQRPKVCRCHIFFGSRARNCRSWCQWPDKKHCKVMRSNNTTPANSRSSSPVRSVNN